MERKLRPVWRRCDARELHPTLIVEGAEIRMQPVGDPATEGSLPWALRACCFFAAEMAVSMRARAPGERGTWRGRIPRSAQSCRNSGHLWREMRSAAGLLSPLRCATACWMICVSHSVVARRWCMVDLLHDFRVGGARWEGER
jgi:hypothetical protein